MVSRRLTQATASPALSPAMTAAPGTTHRDQPPEEFAIALILRGARFNRKAAGHLEAVVAAPAATYGFCRLKPWRALRPPGWSPSSRWSSPPASRLLASGLY